MTERARRPLPTLHEYFDAWQRQHNAPDVDPRSSFFLRSFLAFTYWLSRPIALLGIGPMWVTASGLVVACGAFGLSGRYAIAAGALVLVSALVDGVDGCVAALTGRATKLGFVIDSVADRVADGLFVGALVRSGGSARVAIGAMATVMMLEYTRARAGNAGLGEVGVVTVGERPTRVIACVLGLLGSSVGGADGRASTTALWLILTLSGVGFAQLARHVVPKLR